MKPSNLVPVTFLLLAGLALGACSENPEETQTDAGQVNPDTDAGTQAGVTQTVGATGGTVSVGGIEIKIPAGALSADQSLTLTATTASVPLGYAALSPLYRFEPAGVIFAQPVTVTLSFAGGTNPSVYWSRLDGAGYDELGGTVSSATISTTTSHFSTAFVAEAGGPAETADGGTTTADGGATDVTDAGGTDTADAGSVGPGPVSVEALAAAYTNLWERCLRESAEMDLPFDPVLLEAELPDQAYWDAYEETQVTNLSYALTNPHFHIDRAAYDACVSYIPNGGDCRVVDAAPWNAAMALSSCEVAIVGDVPVGGGCSSGECVPEAYCRATGGQCGTCVARAALNEPCHGSGSSTARCRFGLVCNSPTFTCTQPTPIVLTAQAGDACTLTDSNACQIRHGSKLACRNDGQGFRCVPLQAVELGESCDLPSGSTGHPARICMSMNSTTWCVGASGAAIGTCVARPTVGEACTVNCNAFEATCNPANHTCLARPTAGQPCNSSGTLKCAPGLGCSDQSVCVPKWTAPVPLQVVEWRVCP